MKKRILVALALVLSLLMTAFSSIAVLAAPGDTDAGWECNTATATEAEDGFTTIGNLGWGARTWKSEKQRLEGLKITMKVSNLSGSDVAGFYLTNDTANGYYGTSTPLCVSLWYAPGFAATQSRLHFGTNHDAGASSVVYPSPECEAVGCGVAGSMVFNNIANGTLTVEFNSYNDELWAIKVSIAEPDLMWGNNANYNADEMSSTVYYKKADIADYLDEDGKIYVVAAGLDNPEYQIKVEEFKCAECTDADKNGVCDVCLNVVEVLPYESIIGVADTDWVNYAGATSAAFAENGYSAVSGLASWGSRAYYSHLVKFDGLEIGYRVNSNSGDCVGFLFSNDPGAYFGDASPFAITSWDNLYSGQTRLNFGADHNYNNNSAVYSDPECTTLGCGIASSMVCNAADVMGWTFKFSSYDEDTYQIKVTMTDSTMWEAVANYNAEEQSMTVYLPKSTMAGILNENGECYVISAGFPSGANPSITAEYKVVDDNYNAYLASDAVTNAQEAVNAYKEAAKAITDGTTYDAAMAAKAAAVEAVNGLRSRETAELNMILVSVDASIASNPEIVNIIKKAVTDKIEAAQAAYDALKADNTTVTGDSLAAAKALEIAANDEYAARAAMLSDEAKGEIETSLAALAYSYDYSTALLWVVEFENSVAALATSETVVADLVALKEYREGYATSTAASKIDTVLNETDKAELTGRISAADEDLAEIENVQLPALKESYIAAMEAKLEADLTVKPNLDDAKLAYNEIATYVEITEADGELYTRYVAGYNAIKAACEAYVTAEINAVDALLDERYVSFFDFSPVRDRYGKIKMDYLMEVNTDIAAEYVDLTKKIEKNAFFYVGQTDLPAIEQNETGIAIESKVAFPARLNYNKLLDLKKGTEVVVELTSAAYYNDGTSANNLCFNFLAAPNSYKSMSDGISIIIWLYATECSVQIMNNNDVALASGSISTPMDGETITISVKYDPAYYSFVEDAEYPAYVIKVNTAEFVMKPEVLTSQGYTMTDDVYFSMGSFADDKTTNNMLTLVSVDGQSLGYVEETDEPCTEHVDANTDNVCDVCGAAIPSDDQPPVDTPTGDGTDETPTEAPTTGGDETPTEAPTTGTDDTPEKKGCKSSMGLGIFAIVASMSLAGVVICKKKKAN